MSEELGWRFPTEETWGEVDGSEEGGEGGDHRG